MALQDNVRITFAERRKVELENRADNMRSTNVGAVFAAADRRIDRRIVRAFEASHGLRESSSGYSPSALDKHLFGKIDELLQARKVLPRQVQRLVDEHFDDSSMSIISLRKYEAMPSKGVAQWFSEANDELGLDQKAFAQEKGIPVHTAPEKFADRNPEYMVAMVRL